MLKCHGGCDAETTAEDGKGVLRRFRGCDAETTAQDGKGGLRRFRGCDAETTGRGWQGRDSVIQTLSQECTSLRAEHQTSELGAGWLEKSYGGVLRPRAVRGCVECTRLILLSWERLQAVFIYRKLLGSPLGRLLAGMTFVVTTPDY